MRTTHGWQRALSLLVLLLTLVLVGCNGRPIRIDLPGGANVDGTDIPAGVYIAKLQGNGTVSVVREDGQPVPQIIVWTLGQAKFNVGPQKQCEKGYWWWDPEGNDTLAVIAYVNCRTVSDVAYINLLPNDEKYAPKVRIYLSWEALVNSANKGEQAAKDRVAEHVKQETPQVLELLGMKPPTQTPAPGQTCHSCQCKSKVTHSQAVVATKSKPGMGRRIDALFAANPSHVRWGNSGEIRLPQRTALLRLNGQSVNWKLPNIKGLQAIHGPEQNDSGNFYFVMLQDQVDVGALKVDILPFCGDALNPERDWDWWGKK